MGTTRKTATIRGVQCDIETQHKTDDLGDYTILAVTAQDTGLPLYADDPVIEGHATEIDVHRIVTTLSRGLTCPELNWVA